MMTLQDIFARIFRPVGPRRPMSPGLALVHARTHDQAPVTAAAYKTPRRIRLAPRKK